MREPLTTILALGAALGCTATSPYTRARLSGAVEARSGALLRDRTDGSELSLPPGTRLEDGLSEEEAVAIALWNHAPFQADLESLGVARADLVSAGMIKNPLVTLLLPAGPRQLELTASLSIPPLWQRPARVRAAKLDVERVAGGLLQHALDLVRDVKVAFSNLQLALDAQRLAEESHELQSRISAIAQGRLRAGDISEIEAGLVAAEAIRSGQELMDASRDVGTKEDVLRSLIAMAGDPRSVDPRPGPEEPQPIADLSANINAALALRPDLRAAEIGLEAAAARLGWERSKILGELTAQAKQSEVNGEDVVGPGLALEIPVFNRNQGPRLAAEAEIARARWQLADVRRRVVLDVRAAQRQHEGATESLQLLRDGLLRTVRENVDRAERAFADGNVSYLSVLEATRRRVEAERREADAVAQLRRAVAELERSIGGKHVGAS